MQSSIGCRRGWTAESGLTLPPPDLAGKFSGKQLSASKGCFDKTTISHQIVSVLTHIPTGGRNFEVRGEKIVSAGFRNIAPLGFSRSVCFTGNLRNIFCFRQKSHGGKLNFPVKWTFLVWTSPDPHPYASPPNSQTRRPLYVPPIPLPTTPSAPPISVDLCSPPRLVD